jgi:acetyl esterase/lipase
MRYSSILLAAILLQDPPKIKETKDLAYYEGEGFDDKKHRLSLFIPESDKPVPVLMWIHGGAWAAGDRSIYTELGRRFAEAGIGFAAISYRLSPGVKHPEHVKDCARAFAWLHANIAKHGGDPKKLFVSGQSAGGHLSALLVLDRKHLDELKVPRDAIRGAIPMSGVYTIPALKEGTNGFLRIFPQAFGSDEKTCEEASPTTHVKNCTIPMLVLTETDDNFRVRPSMEQFKEAIEKAGVKGAEFKDAEGRNHISIVSKMASKGDDPQRAAMVEFVRRHSKDE